MVEHISSWIVNLISSLGYLGIIIAMTIESALIPLPSEIIMPFSGFLASTGRFSLIFVALSGALGNLIGSLLAYALGYYGHERIVRRLVRRYGKWILLSEDELDKAEKLMHKYKDVVVLVSRVIPGVRTIISLPAGIARLPLWRFIALTFIGSFIWSYFLAYIGYVLGKNWDTLGVYFHSADAVIIILVLALGAFYFYHKLKHFGKERKS